MDTVGICEAKKRFSELLGRVARGERITITRRGLPIAAIVPTRESYDLSVHDAIAQASRLRGNRRIVVLPIGELQKK